MNPFKYHTCTTRFVQYTRLSLSKWQCVVFARAFKVKFISVMWWISISKSDEYHWSMFSL